MPAGHCQPGRSVSWFWLFECCYSRSVCENMSVLANAPEDSIYWEQIFNRYVMLVHVYRVQRDILVYLYNV